MTMRVVPEAVEPHARSQLYSQHDPVWTRGDNLRRFFTRCYIDLCINRIAHTSSLHGRSGGMTGVRFIKRFVSLIAVDDSFTIVVYRARGLCA